MRQIRSNATANNSTGASVQMNDLFKMEWFHHALAQPVHILHTLKIKSLFYTVNYYFINRLLHGK